MPIELLALDAEQTARVLGSTEGHFLDAKAREVAPAKLSRSLSAFANADGGELYVGLDEKDGIFTWRGFDDSEDANGHIQVFEQLFPLGDGFSYEFLSSAVCSGVVLHIVVLRSAQVRKASNATPYLRRGAQNLPVSTPEALKQLERDKGITSFENETVDVDIPSLSNSEIMIEFMLAAFPLSEPEPWLRKQRVILRDKPTVAGVLLFDDLPQSSLPKRSSVKIYRYRTSAESGTRETLDDLPETIEGPLVTQIERAVQRTTKIVENFKTLDDRGLQTVEYPTETLHEIITNALLHRDYGLADDVHIRIFDNRIEVESPGRLAGHVSPSNILNERFARNGSIVRLVNKFPDPPNKDVGEGLNTAFAAMKKLQLKDPVIRELDHSVLVNIRHERLASPEQMVMEWLETHDEVTNRIVRDLTGIGSENTVKNVFYRLMRTNQIERVPGKKGILSAYRIPVAQPEGKVGN
jgi:ATP-dependent DNA helicase RecG